jgi:hypothetical protein
MKLRNICLLSIIFSLIFTVKVFATEEIYYEFPKQEINNDNIYESYEEAINIKNNSNAEKSAKANEIKTYMSSGNDLKSYILSELYNVSSNIVYEDYVVENYTTNEEESVKIKSVLDEIWAEVKLNPEYFYVVGYSSSFGGYFDSNGTTAHLQITFIPTYYLTADEVSEYRTKINKTVESFTSQISSSMTTLDKLIYTDNYICQNVVYDYDLANNRPNDASVSHTMAGALADGLAVCDGYSKSYIYLLSKIGVDATMVVSTDLNHAWNHVKIGDSYYNVDVTWNDGYVYKYGYTLYKYFLISDDSFNSTEYGHNATDWVMTEKAESKYYEENNFVWKDYDGYILYNNGYWYRLSKNTKVQIQKWKSDAFICEAEYDYQMENGIGCYALASDGKKLYMVDGKYDIYSMDFDGNNAELVSSEPESANLLEYRNGKIYYKYEQNPENYLYITLPTDTENVEFTSLPIVSKDSGDYIKVDTNLTLEKLSVSSNFPALENGYTVVVLDAKGNKKTDTDRIGSGCKIQIQSDGKVEKEYTIFVRGDVDGDGRARIFDSFTMIDDNLNNKVYSDIDYLIRDFDNDGKIRIFDAFNYLDAAIRN